MRDREESRRVWEDLGCRAGSFVCEVRWGGFALLCGSECGGGWGRYVPSVLIELRDRRLRLIEIWQVDAVDRRT